VADWIFFDCFNTLIDDFDPTGDESGLGSLPELAVELGAVARRDDFLAAYGQVRPSAAPPHLETDLKTRLHSVVVGGARLRPDAAAGAVQRLLQRWHEEYEPGLRLTPGVAEMLSYWSGKKRFGVISNFYMAGYPQRYLERFGLGPYFEFVLDSAAFGQRKPGPPIFEEALRRAGCAPAQVTFIGDRLDLDIEPAHALGMHAIHLHRGADRPGDPATPLGLASLQHWREFR
jgi:HAD superfamily hydrolase (TIGR01549 family)